MKHIITSLVYTLAFLSFDIVSTEGQNATRVGKLIPIFQVVTFPNLPCVGSSSRNGTCYTSEECTTRGGISAGSCAQGFGVCCTFSIACGATTSQNCTYLIQAATTNPTSDPCVFTICKDSADICRIRLDFTTFSIAGPVTGSVIDSNALEDNGGTVGDCLMDSFTLTSPGNQASPVICGFNTGQHMIVDASDQCHKASFDFSGTATTRQFEIKVTQYQCGDELGGPDGCLQFFTGNTGQFASFNFPTTSSTVTSTVTHLSNQCYNMCFRQEVGKCAICFNVVIEGTGATDQGSFGLSIAFTAAMADGVQDSKCSEDYLQIPGGERSATGALFAVGSIALIGHDRICGRSFGHTDTEAEGAANNEESICSK
ncbi:uncharacterized protein LOC131885067 isoform X2 [Tigriopus californicus]|uniref:uncharacterized protein LOC131885067 isoform X2 n=1 Tax=Tigriopus californicus TaxID=6832 RepID=UPI0027DA9D24|nr:uncharacterized protein LOC131885067 isoform X2 [Tigriopus californicus]